MNPIVLHPKSGCLSVLIIEDDPALGRLIQLILGQHTDRVTVVRSGRAAIEEMATNSSMQLPRISASRTCPDWM